MDKTTRFIQDGWRKVEAMQISRHWRMKALRYRLQGVRYNNGAVSLQARPNNQDSNNRTSEKRTAQPAAAGRHVA
ncbi:MAG: hypothetical protein D6712_00385 [Chloroflexi bacterium]|nr:MAG: hypothetical protein D6712_00385 [Chloroflexota bacterium]